MSRRCSLFSGEIIVLSVVLMRLNCDTLTSAVTFDLLCLSVDKLIIKRLGVYEKVSDQDYPISIQYFTNPS